MSKENGLFDLGDNCWLVNDYYLFLRVDVAVNLPGIVALFSLCIFIWSTLPIPYSDKPPPLPGSHPYRQIPHADKSFT